MLWNIVRLDLAHAPSHPDGSREHCYFLRLPLNPAGFVDQRRLRDQPEEATVLRSWPGEPERSGHLAQVRDRWVISYGPDQHDGEAVFHLETHPFRPGEYVTITGPEGRPLSFRVWSCQAL
jgi:hypothetical protein